MPGTADPNNSKNDLSKKILIIDTDEFLAKLFRYKLEADGFAVTVLTDTAKALATIREGGFDLVLTELLLDDFDGFELLQALKKSPQDRGAARIIAFTRLGGKEDAETARRLGADDIWVKTEMTPQEVILRIKMELAKRADKK